MTLFVFLTTFKRISDIFKGIGPLKSVEDSIEVAAEGAIETLGLY